MSRAAERRYGRRGGRWVPPGATPGQAAADLAQLRDDAGGDLRACSHTRDGERCILDRGHGGRHLFGHQTALFDGC